MLTRQLCLGIILVAGVPMLAYADDLTIASRIAAVTVYPSGATVVRTASVTLPIGPSTVLVNDLPLDVDPTSLKVEGNADFPIAIASVDTRLTEPGKEKDPKRVALEADIQAIQDKIDAWDSKLGALDGRRRFLEALIEATPNGFSKALGEGQGDPAQWAAAAATIGQGLAEIAEQEQAAHIEKRTLQKQLDEKQVALNDLPEPEQHLAVRIALDASAAAKGALAISYRTMSARWLPTYDAQLATGDKGGEPTLALVRRAEVTQSTGEDWTNVRLTLSTAPVAGGTSAPQLSPFLVRLFDPDDYRNRESASGGFQSVAPAAKALEQDNIAIMGDLAAPAPVSVTEAVASFGDFRAEYIVPGVVSVESGVGARSMQISTDKIPAKLTVKAVPMLSDAAYLQASFTPPKGAPLLAGRVSLFRDGTFVGNGAVPFTNAGDNLDLGFGVDDNVKVVRTEIERTTGEHGILSSRKTDLRRYKIAVHNLHARPIDIIVLDRIPYAEDENVTIARVDGTTEPTAVDVDDQRGIVAWQYTYAADESRDILNGYEVSWPSGQQLVSLD